MKILVIRFSSIGDIVLTTPILRGLKKRFPDAEIHYLTKAQFHPLLIANPHINKFYLLEDKLARVIEDLKQENYDIIVDLHKNIRSMRVRKALDAEVYTFDKLNFEKWLKVNLKVDMLPGKHLVDRYFEALEPLGVKNDGQGLDYYIWEREIYDFLLNLVNTPYVAFVLGAMHGTKKLTPDMIERICERLQGKVVLLGGKEEAELGAYLNEKMPAKIINLCGKISINESAFVIKHARKVITHDTGLMHIAAAFKKPMAVIWGNTVPEFGMYPYFGERHDLLAKRNVKMFQVEGLPCRPCSKIGYEDCPKEHFNCMKLHDVDKIAETVNSN